MAIRAIPGFDADGNPELQIVDDANVKNLIGKARQALTNNQAYLAEPAIPAGTLTTAQLSAVVRILRQQLDATTRQLQAVERLLLGNISDVSDT